MSSITIPGESIQDPDLEKTVLTSIMINEKDFDIAFGILTPECFDTPTYREIYDAMCAVFNQGRFPDMLLTSYELSARGSKITPAEVTLLFADSVQVIDIEPHAYRLRELADRRKLWRLGMILATKACNESCDLEAIHTEASETLDSILSGMRRDIVTVEEVYTGLQKRMLINRDLKEGETRGTPTGFDFIDRAGGLLPTELIVVAAESSKGKTSFATALTLKAVEHGHPVAFYSLEMQPEDLTARIASMKTGISVTKILNQKMDISEIYTVDHAMEQIRRNSLFYDARTMVSLDSMLASIRRMKKRHDIRGAVVDYLQLIDISARGCNREQATAECARKLKNLAMELGIWIIAISQLNRANDGELPTMSRLRGSGQIAEAANNIYLIHRTETGYPAPHQDVPVENTAMVIVAKGRNTGTGSFVTGFRPENTLFYPLTPSGLAELQCPAFSNRKPRTVDAPLPDAF